MAVPCLAPSAATAGIAPNPPPLQASIWQLRRVPASCGAHPFPCFGDPQHWAEKGSTRCGCRYGCRNRRRKGLSQYLRVMVQQGIATPTVEGLASKQTDIANALKRIQVMCDSSHVDPMPTPLVPSKEARRRPSCVHCVNRICCIRCVGCGHSARPAPPSHALRWTPSVMDGSGRPLRSDQRIALAACLFPSPSGPLGVPSRAGPPAPPELVPASPVGTFSPGLA